MPATDDAPIVANLRSVRDFYFKSEFPFAYSLKNSTYSATDNNAQR